MLIGVGWIANATKSLPINVQRLIFSRNQGNTSTDPRFDAPPCDLVPTARKKPSETEGFAGLR